MELNLKEDGDEFRSCCAYEEELDVEEITKKCLKYCSDDAFLMNFLYEFSSRVPRFQTLITMASISC